MAAGGAALCLLQASARVPGPAVSAAQDFLIPGLEGLHFVAYGSTQGSVVVACARQQDHIGAAQDDADSPAGQLETLLVLDLQQPAADAAALAVPASQGPGTPPRDGSAAQQTAHAPLADPVLHVAYGGGPHLLLAACTRDMLVVVSLEGIAAHLCQQQTSSAAGRAAVVQHALWHQLAAAHCGHADVLAISWTQQLDGILTSSSDGQLTMWELQPLAAPPARSAALPGIAAPPAATLRVAWSVHATIPQRLVCAGVSKYAPSATAAGHSSEAMSPADSPAKEGSSGSAFSSPARDSSAGQRYVNVWWPQIREQRQRHYAAGMRPAVGQEKLRHPTVVTGLQWSPGVLQKDALSSTGGTPGGPAGASPPPAAAPGSPSWATSNSPGSPTTAAAVAATEAEDHPALMTLTEDGTVRVWVETLVLTENTVGTPLPVRQPTPGASPSLQRNSPGLPPTSSGKGSVPSGAGSPGAAPSTPRDARSAAAVAAALGAATPAITSYFCMALVIDSAATAGGAAASPARSSEQAGSAGAGSRRPHVALWARHAAAMLLHKQQRRVASPVLWLFTATVESRPGGTHCRVLMHLHAVRGLAAIVMSAGYGGSLSSTSGGSASTRPAAVLWGQHSWDLPASAVGASLPLLLERLCCWVSDEEGYPLLHAFTSSTSGAGGRLLLAGRTFATVQEDRPLSGQVHKQLAVVSSWQGVAVAHEQPVTAFAASSSSNGVHTPNGSSALAASCDGSGRLLIWRGSRMQHLAAVPAAAVGSTAALAWLPFEGLSAAPAPGVEASKQVLGRLAVGSGSMLQCYAASSKQAIAVATAALPAGCSSILSLHTMGGAPAASCILLAVCSSSTGRGSVVCAWHCSLAGEGAGSIQLQLAGTAQVPAAAAVTAAVSAGSQQLLVGTADGAVLLLSVVADDSGVQLLQAASVAEQGRVAAVGADKHCMHVASASHAAVSVWSAAVDRSSGEGCQQLFYSQAASVPLPPGAGSVSAVTWLPHSVSPCLAVATTSCSIFLLSAVRRAGSSSWEWLAHLPTAVGGGGAQRMHLAVGGGSSSLMAAAGNQLLRLSDWVLAPSDGDEGPSTKLLGRVLLECSGPLPQYHPAFLAALLLTGKHAVAAAVLQRLVMWLTARQQQAMASLDAATAQQPPSPGMPVGRDMGDAASGYEQPAASFAGLPLADMVDSQLMHLPSLLDRIGAPSHPGKATWQPAGSASGAPGPAAASAAASQQSGSVATGALDLAAFGMAPPAVAEPQQQQQQPAGGLDTGMLDLAAFGMAPPAAAEPPPQQQQPAGGFDSGMLDLAAFSMAPPAAAEPPPQQQQPAGGFDSGMLDLAAFGMAPPAAAEPPPPQQQQPAGGLDTGMLDMAAFGMAPPAAAQAALPPQTSSSIGPPSFAPSASPSQPVVRQLVPPRQPMLPAQQLLPVAAECQRQLAALLLPADAQRDQEEPELVGSASFGAGSRAGEPAGSASSQSLAQQAGPQTLMPEVPVPGLSLAETSAVLAIAGAFSSAAAAEQPRALNGTSGGPTVDTAAAHFITAVGLAHAIGGSEQQPAQQQQGAQAQQQARVTVMNAAGVAYTLAPSSVAGTGGAGGGDDGHPLGQRWGLLPGLDATALLWALLSGTEEEMLQQAAQRLQQLQLASAAASSDTGAFLAMKASKGDQAADALSEWSHLRQLGAGFWLRDARALAAMAERLAKQQFAARRNADDCALLYCALGKRSVLQGLYRSTQNRRLAEFLARDFAQEQHRQAAQKNAFVLMSQHRYELAAAFFVLGNQPDEAVGVAAHDMKDPQLALLLCRLLHGATGTPSEQRLLQQLREQAEACPSGDAAAAAAACCWLLGDADAVVQTMLRTERAKLRAAGTAEHAAQLLPLLHLLLSANPPHSAEQQADWRRQLQRCLCALAASLQGCGLHALAVQAAVAAGLDHVHGQEGAAGQQHELLEQLLAAALLPGVLEQHDRGQRHLEADAGYQLELLQQQGVALDAPAILARVRHLRRAVLAAGPHEQQQGMWAQPAAAPQRSLERQHSSGGSSYRSKDSEPTLRWQQQRYGTAVVGDGQVLFRVDNDRLEAVACCPLMSPDVLGRPVVVASHRHGLVEGQLHVMPEPLSPLQEVPDSPEAAAAAALEEEQQQRGSVFGRLLSQLFDQSTWQQDPTWHHGTAEFDVVGAAADSAAPGGGAGAVGAHTIMTGALAAHPHKQLYLSGCSGGRLHLWQFGERRALATYTPVPGSELDSISKTFSGLLSFSRSFKQSPAAPRLANWGKAAAVRFAPSGERFAAIGEGGVVATWRLDAPSRQADGDGHGCAEWWHQSLSKQGCAVDFVCGSSSVLVVGGRCQAGGGSSLGSGCSNLSVWDTMAPAASSCVGRLSNHQATVTAVSMLPCGWLLTAGDADGSLSCTDLRMMGGSSGPRLLWSVKAARGSLKAVVTIPGPGSVAGTGLARRSSGALLATAGADGAVRVWRGADGRLLQSIECAHFSSRPPSAGSRRSSHDGVAGAPISPSAGHAPPGAHPLPVTGLAVSEEGLVSSGADGCVRLFSFL